MGLSQVDKLRRTHPEKYRALVESMSKSDLIAYAILGDWDLWAREEQRIPDQAQGGGDWFHWLYLAGRGAGKTRTGAETVRKWAMGGYRRIGLIAPTAGDVRDVMIEGESGLLSVCREDDVDYKGKPLGKPLYEPSKRRVTWANGAQCALYSADEPERLRGPQHEKLWADELCAWRRPITWDLAMFGLRLGDCPQVFVSTTPKPSKIIRELVKDPRTALTRGTTFDNARNLAAAFLDKVKDKYEGTRLGRQELHGELLFESQGALWTRDMLDQARAGGYPSHSGFWFTQITVSVDPAVTKKRESNETGIVVTGRDNHGMGWVLADYTGVYSPTEWASKAIWAYHAWAADSILAEANQGGDMVRDTIMSVDGTVHVRLVWADRGKGTRAAPIAALFEQRKVAVLHVPTPEPHDIVTNMTLLEDQLCTWEPNAGHESPDRLDAMVWGLTDCMVSGYGETGERRLGGTH